MNRQGIEQWLEKHEIKNYIINSDLSVDVDDDVNVNLYHGDLTELPFQFGKVIGYFDCAHNQRIQAVSVTFCWWGRLNGR